jgi:hypothetical protein
MALAMNEYTEKTKQGICEIPLKSWEEFISHVKNKHAHSPALIYRGQAEAEWKIESTLDRLEARFPKYKNYWGNNPEYFDCPPVPRDVHLEAFKEAVRGKRGGNPQDLTEYEWWALAQHHGLATPLLDWTYSPFVALFFAFEEAGYIYWKNKKFCEPDNRAVYSVPFHLVVENGSEENPAPFLFSPRREITHRLGNQSGVFMNMPRETDLESCVRARFSDQSYGEGNLHPQTILEKMIIPNKDRIECLRLLNKMNINRMSLFADLDGAAKYINSLWEIDFDTALGALPDGVSKEHE